MSPGDTPVDPSRVQPEEGEGEGPFASPRSRLEDAPSPFGESRPASGQQQSGPASSSWGPNLRGSGNRQTQTDDPRNAAGVPIQVNVVQDLKLTVASLPENYGEYPQWRFQLRANILNLPVEVTVIMKFLHELEVLTFEQLGANTITVDFMRVDAKLYSAVVNAMKGKSFIELTLSIQTDVQFGKGRQCVKLLDKTYGFELRKLAALASKWLSSASVAEMAKLSEFVKTYKYQRFILKEYGTPIPEIVAMDLLLQMLEKTKICELTIETFKAKEEEDKTLQKLVVLLQEKGDSWLQRQAHEDKRKDGRATLGKSPNPHKDTVCSGCQLKGHSPDTCWVLHPEKAPQSWRDKKKKGKSKGKGGGKPTKDYNGNTLKGAAGKGKGDKSKGKWSGAGSSTDRFPPCEFCGRRQHPKEECWYNPAHRSSSDGIPGMGAAGWFQGPVDPNQQFMMVPYQQQQQPPQQLQIANNAMSANARAGTAFSAWLQHRSATPSPSGALPYSSQTALPWPGYTGKGGACMAKKGLMRMAAENEQNDVRNKAVNEAVMAGDMSMITESEYMNLSPEDTINISTTGRGCFGVEAGSTTRVWALDSGASSHLVNSGDRNSIIKETDAHAELETVKGPVVIDRGAVVEIPQIGGAQPALMLDYTPNCASMGRLIDDSGYGIVWFKGDCRWYDPEGNFVNLDRYDYVPVLEDLGVNSNLACLATSITTTPQTSVPEDSLFMMDLMDFEKDWTDYSREKACVGTHSDTAASSNDPAPPQRDGPRKEKIEYDDFIGSPERTYADMGFFWVGRTWLQRESGIWQSFEHERPRRQRFAPGTKDEAAHGPELG
jgi:hypothetical protein